MDTNQMQQYVKSALTELRKYGDDIINWNVIIASANIPQENSKDVLNLLLAAGYVSIPHSTNEGSYVRMQPKGTAFLFNWNQSDSANSIVYNISDNQGDLRFGGNTIGNSTKTNINTTQKSTLDKMWEWIKRKIGLGIIAFGLTYILYCIFI